MNVLRYSRVLVLFAALLLGGCASYPYYGYDGVYYGQDYYSNSSYYGYGNYGYGYHPYYYYSPYRYSYYSYRNYYSPYYGGYYGGGYYYDDYYDRDDYYDSDDDYDNGVDEDAGDELHRILNNGIPRNAARPTSGDPIIIHRADSAAPTREVRTPRNRGPSDASRELRRIDFDPQPRRDYKPVPRSRTPVHKPSPRPAPVSRPAPRLKGIAEGLEDRVRK